MFGIEFIFAIAVLIISVVVHEVAHGYAAYAQGDPTASAAGRLTLNPLKHLDILGSLVVPAVSFLLGGFIFGWAKPVPYNPYNLKNQRWGEALVALAGPASNILIALIFGLIIRFSETFTLSSSVVSALGLVVFVNIILAVFNMIPVPPLDGSKLLFALVPDTTGRFRAVLEQYGLVLVLLVLFVVWELLFPIVLFLFSVITGLQGI